jgi:hypothetical protein
MSFRNPAALTMIVFAICLLSSAALAADSPDFSGTWEMDKDASTMSQLDESVSLKETIEQTKSAMKVTVDRATWDNDLHYVIEVNTDGSEKENYLGSMVLVTTGGWVEKKFRTTYEVDSNDGKYKGVELRSLDDNGKTMRVSRVVTTPFGSKMESKLVFRKK